VRVWDDRRNKKRADGKLVILLAVKEGYENTRSKKGKGEKKKTEFFH